MRKFKVVLPIKLSNTTLRLPLFKSLFAQPPRLSVFFISFYFLIKDTLWVLRCDEPLVHVSVDILLITKHILNHGISLES